MNPQDDLAKEKSAHEDSGIQTGDPGIDTETKTIDRGDTELYGGWKLIRAKPMLSHDFKTFIKEEEVPPNEENELGYYVIYPDGYESWSPQDVFEEAYRKISAKEKALF